MVIETHDPEETFEVGRTIGMNAKPGQIYTLTGDLGVGKTVFTQGVAAGLGITEPVSCIFCSKKRQDKREVLCRKKTGT